MIAGAGDKKQNPLQQHNCKIIKEGYFGKKNKTVEEKVRCFLMIMYHHVQSDNSDVKNYYSNSLQEYKTKSNSEMTSDSDQDKDDQIFNKYISLANEICILNTKQMNEQNIESVIHSVEEIMKDDTLIFLLEKINKLTFDEANLIYKIFKSLILMTNLKRFNNYKNYEKFSEVILSYIQKHLEQITKNIFLNLSPCHKDHVIIIVGKLFRKLFQTDSVLKSLLTTEFFEKIYSLTKNEKFVLSQECFKILFYSISSKRVDKTIVSDFFSKNAADICSVINKGILINNSCSKGKLDKAHHVDDFYYMKRETLIFLEKVLCDPAFEKFSTYYLNQPENLKTIMMQLNNKCEKIVFQAIDILYFFFMDVESKKKSINLILHQNKENFYKFFDRSEAMLSESTEMMEKKNFILYELERLENVLDEMENRN